MTKKNISLIQAIIEIIAITFLFIPGVYSQHYFHSAMNGSNPTTKDFAHSLFEAANTTRANYTAIILIALIVLTIAYFIMHYATDCKWSTKKFMIAMPSIQIAGLILNAITITSWEFKSNSSYKNISTHTYKLSWGFFVLLALMVIVILLEAYRLFSNISEKKQRKGDSNMSDISHDLLELQLLLNQGIITEEEFNAKKKQLLEL